MSKAVAALRPPDKDALDGDAELGHGQSLCGGPRGHAIAFVPRSREACVYVVIMGCGRVGSSLSNGLERLGHEVAVIDHDRQAFRRLSPDFRGKQVVGEGYHRDVLIQAGVERADAFAAVSSGDNSNIISARVARETFGIERVVARIYDAKRAAVYERLGIPTVATVPWTTDRLLNVLTRETETTKWRDPTGNVGV